MEREGLQIQIWSSGLHNWSYPGVAVLLVERGKEKCAVVLCKRGVVVWKDPGQF